MELPHIIEEREIQKAYLFKTVSEKKAMGYLDRFEVRSKPRDFSVLENVKDEEKICDDDSDLVGIESQDDMLLYFTGFLVVPKDASKYHKTPSDGEILEKEENRRYYLMCSPSRMWSFDYSEDLGGIWFENDNGWYKILNPSKKYAPFYKPFKKKCDLWLAIHEILQKNFSATFEQVVEKLKGQYNEKYILENGQFIMTNCSNTVLEQSKKKFSSSDFAVELRRKIMERPVEKKQPKAKNDNKKRERTESAVSSKPPKIKKSSSKPKTFINPLLSTSLKKMKKQWKEEADNGELSDSGDRNIIQYSSTCCNFCNKHRHSFIACAQCEEYQLCSVCFTSLEMDKKVNKKFLKGGKTAFEYCGENSLFTCRPCFEHNDDNTSESSLNLDEEN